MNSPSGPDDEDPINLLKVHDRGLVTNMPNPQDIQPLHDASKSRNDMMSPLLKILDKHTVFSME